MPFKIRPSGEKFQVVGPYKDIKTHIYGTHDTEKEATTQLKALYVNANESKDTTVIEDVTPTPPPGVDKSTNNNYPKFRPDLFKIPMQKAAPTERRIMDFEGFLKTINYATHDGTLQTGHGQNLTGK